MITSAIGYFCALLIGLLLGLMGGGGSVLTVPILAYLFHLAPVTATAYSLFVVGATSAVGSYRYATKGLVNFKVGILFGLPAIISVFLTRLYVIPALPDTILSIGNWVLSKDTLIMILFGILMLTSSISMMHKRPPTGISKREMSSSQKALFVILEGLVVGLLTGMVGAGGGFLIIPALVIVSKMGMKEAVATSLLIISAKSLIGFIGDAINYTIDWPFLLGFTVLAIIGVFIGIRLSAHIKASKLQSAFGWFILVMAIGIILKEIFIGN